MASIKASHRKEKVRKGKYLLTPSANWNPGWPATPSEGGRYKIVYFSQVAAGGHPAMTDLPTNWAALQALEGTTYDTLAELDAAIAATFVVGDVAFPSASIAPDGSDNDGILEFEPADAAFTAAATIAQQMSGLGLSEADTFAYVESVIQGIIPDAPTDSGNPRDFFGTQGIFQVRVNGLAQAFYPNGADTERWRAPICIISRRP